MHRIPIRIHTNNSLNSFEYSKNHVIALQENCLQAIRETFRYLRALACVRSVHSTIGMSALSGGNIFQVLINTNQFVFAYRWIRRAIQIQCQSRSNNCDFSDFVRARIHYEGLGDWFTTCEYSIIDTPPFWIWMEHVYCWFAEIKTKTNQLKGSSVSFLIYIRCT